MRLIAEVLGGGRAWARAGARQILEAAPDLRSGAEVASAAQARQLAQHVRGLDDPILDHVAGPLIYKWFCGPAPRLSRRASSPTAASIWRPTRFLAPSSGRGPDDLLGLDHAPDAQDHRRRPPGGSPGAGRSMREIERIVTAMELEARLKTAAIEAEQVLFPTLTRRRAPPPSALSLRGLVSGNFSRLISLENTGLACAHA